LYRSRDQTNRVEILIELDVTVNQYRKCMCCTVWDMESIKGGVQDGDWQETNVRRLVSISEIAYVIRK